MAYNVWLEEPATAVNFGIAFHNLLALSRFRIGSTTFDFNCKENRRQPGRARRRRGQLWRFRNIRLRHVKDYCGQHAFSCAVANPGRPPGRHRHAAYLEGADWVAFNDMVNDVLDDLNVSAEVWSDARNVERGVSVRHGFRRCVEYQASLAQGGDWLREGVFADWRKRKKRRRAKYPAGTPGLAKYLLSPGG